MSSGLSNVDIADALKRAQELAATGGGQKRRLESDYPPQGHSHQHQQPYKQQGDPPSKRPAHADMNPIATLGHPPMGMMGGGGGGGQGGGAEETKVLEVPDSAVGLIIGKGGEQITAIQRETNCRIQLAPNQGGQAIRVCTLTGSGQAIMNAESVIMSIVERSAQRQGGGGGGMGGPGGPMRQGSMSNGGSMQAGPNAMGHITVEMAIPPGQCGLIIGKSGTTIKELQENTGVTMKMIQDTNVPGNAPKPLRITGPPNKVQEAQRRIHELLSTRSEQPRPGGGFGGGPGGGFGGGPGAAMGVDKGIGEVIVPKSSVGVIIGRGGETIKRLAVESGAKIQFKNEADEADPNGAERTAVIQGTIEQIRRATDMITQLVKKAMDGSGGGGGGGGGQDIFYMHVPATKTGLVIGKGGEAIKAINGESGAHVELSREPPPNPHEKVFVIKGSPYQIHVAQHLIRIKVGDIPVGTPVPPGPAQGGPMGGGGPGGQPGADPYAMGGMAPGQPGAGGQPGAPYGAQFNAYGMAQYPSVTSAQQPQQQWPGAQPAGGGYPGQPGAPAGGAGPQPQDPQAAWAQYYQQTQQTQPQPMAASNPYGPGATGAGGGASAGPMSAGGAGPPQQQQQPQPAAAQPAVSAASQSSGTAPAINPVTGQPDYSAQWIEYYRSLGMHEQARMIEDQARQSQMAVQQQQHQQVGQQPAQMGAAQQQMGQPQQMPQQQQQNAGAWRPQGAAQGPAYAGGPYAAGY